MPRITGHIIVIHTSSPTTHRAREISLSLWLSLSPSSPCRRSSRSRRSPPRLPQDRPPGQSPALTSSERSPMYDTRTQQSRGRSQASDESGRYPCSKASAKRARRPSQLVDAHPCNNVGNVLRTSRGVPKVAVERGGLCFFPLRMLLL